jgi:hypothetical protein
MMKKIRCPRCGVINLEKFVTYPHCAGCGSMLPQLPEEAEHLPVWRRPLGPLLWVTAIAGAVVALVVAATMFERTPVEAGKLMVYGRAARNIRTDSELAIYLTLDPVDSEPTQQNETLKDVSLRLSREILENFEFVSLAPPPDSVLRSGTGRYLEYVSLPRDTQLELTLRPRQPGVHTISIAIYARDRDPAVPYNLTVRVTPATKRKSSQSVPARKSAIVSKA